MKKTDIEGDIPYVGTTWVTPNMRDQSFVDAGILARRGFASHANYKGPEAETFDHAKFPSLTVPDMTLSLRQLVDRHMRGQAVKTFTVANVPENSMIPDNLERMSALDRAEFSQQIADFQRVARGKLITAKQARQQAEFDKLVDDRAKLRLAALAELGAGEQAPG